MRLGPTPTLEGGRIRLRPLRHGDVEQRAALGRWPDINQAFGGDLVEPATLTVDEARAQLLRPMVDGVGWVIALSDGDRFIGTTRLDRIDGVNRAANFAIGIFDPEHLGRGLGSEAIDLVLGFGFQQLGLHRISLTVLAANKPAIAAYRSCGFEVEGRLRETLRRSGVWEDDLVMAILEQDYRSRSQPPR